MTHDERRITGFDDLSDAEYLVLMEATTGEPRLHDLVNAWVPSEDAPYWNRKGAYVPELIPAAELLLRAGLVEVWAQPRDGIGEGGIVPRDVAEQAVSEVDNWWTYDPEGNWDPDEDLSRYAAYERQEPSPLPDQTYTLLSTDDVRELAPPSRPRARDFRPYPDPEYKAVAYGLGMRWDIARELLVEDPHRELLCPELLDAVVTVTPVDTAGPQGKFDVSCPECHARRIV